MFKKNTIKTALSVLFIFIGLQCMECVANSKGANVVEDSVITAEVKTKFASDKIVSPLNIQVETNNGVVLLKGDVKSYTEANKAVELAYSVRGVHDVDLSHLLIQGSSHPVNDALITAKIKGLFMREKVFGDKPIEVSEIHVETNDGIVYLSGKISSKAQIENVEKLANSVKGVKEVKSTIELKDK